MGLRIIIQEDKVRIPKLNEEFPLVLPEKSLSEQAQQILEFLKNSPYLQKKTSLSHQKSIFSILQTYGEKLFQAIVPKSYQKQLQNPVNLDRELELCIYFFPWLEIAWELLHNGKNWHNLDAGVKRIYLGKAKMRHYKSADSWHFLSCPIIPCKDKKIPSCEFFQTPIEWLQPEQKNIFNRFSWNIVSQAKEQEIINAFSQSPRYMYLEGFHDLGKICCTDKKYEIKTKDLEQLAFETSVESGLELLVCNLKQISTSDRIHNALLHNFFQLGLPNLINFSGSLHKRLMSVYMSHLLFYLAQAQKIFSSHWKGIRAIAQGGSWDWIWVQFWQNEQKLAAQQAAINQNHTTPRKSNELFYAQQPLWNSRIFRGNLHTLEKLEKKIYDLAPNQSLFVWDKCFQNIENYLTQFSIKYYQEIATINVFFQWETSFPIPKFHPNELQSSYEKIQEYFAQEYRKYNNSFFAFPQHQNLEQGARKIIFVFFPSNIEDINNQITEFHKNFAAWVTPQKKQPTNYSFVFISYGSENSKPIHQKQTYLLESNSILDSMKFFDIASQTTIEKRLSKAILTNTPLSYRLLKMLFLLKIQDFSQVLITEESLWELVLLHFKKRINEKQKKILILCFLLPIPICIRFFQKIFPKALAEIEALYSCQLLERNASHTQIQLEGGMRFLIEKYKFFDEQELQKGRLTLVNIFQTSSPTYPKLFSIFLHCHFVKVIKQVQEEQLQEIYKYANNWQLKKIFYAKVFELCDLPQIKTLEWIMKFYSDLLVDSSDSFWIKEIQVFSNLLEEKEKWDLFFQCQIIICNFFLSQNNFQKVRNILAPVIELAKNGVFSIKQIVEIAVLLVKIDDNRTYLALLDYFSSDLQDQQTIELPDQVIFNAYQFFLQGEKQKFLELMGNEIQKKSNLNMGRYYKIYQAYIQCCNNQNKIENLNLFIFKIAEELTNESDYNHYQTLIFNVFQAVATHKKKYTTQSSHNLFALLEKLYYFAKINKEQKTTYYADILGQLYYEVGNEQKYKIYLEDYYKKTTK